LLAGFNKFLKRISVGSVLLYGWDVVLAFTGRADARQPRYCAHIIVGGKRRRVRQRDGDNVS
jgi:hypothetical protein